MKDLFSVGEAAKAVGTTAETLRHYDRIGLVKPGVKDEWTNYRYYTRQDLIRLNTVRALQQMDLPLRKIREVLAYDDLERIIAFLTEAEQNADEKIAALSRSKEKIRAAKQDYASKLRHRAGGVGYEIREYPARIILLSDTLKAPTLDNLWNYLSHFYGSLPGSLREQFRFENLAGIYTDDAGPAMFALCSRFAQAQGLRTLPAGRYLCAECTEAEKAETEVRLKRIARDEYGAAPDFAVALVVISGILQWRYELQIPIDGIVK